MIPAQVDKSARRRSYLYVLVTVGIWGIATPVIKSTITYIPPMTFLAIRFWMASLITIPLTFYYLRRHKINILRFKRIVTASFLGHIGALALFFLGLERTSAIQGSVMSMFGPPLVSLLGFVYLKEFIKKGKLEGTLIAFIGTLIIIIEPIISGRQNIDISRVALLGNILILAGVTLDSLYAVYTKKRISNDKIITPFMQISMSFVIAAFVFTPFALLEQYSGYTKTPAEHLKICTPGDYDKYVNNAGLSCNINGCHSTTDINNYVCKAKNKNFRGYLGTNFTSYIDGKAMWGVVYMAILSGILAYTLYSSSLKYLEASEASLFYYMQPIFGIPVAVIFLKERMSIIFVIGALLIALGIYKAEKSKK